MAYRFKPGIVYIEDNRGNSVNIMGLLSDSNSQAYDNISNSYILSTCIQAIKLKNKISSTDNSNLWNEILK